MRTLRHAASITLLAVSAAAAQTPASVPPAPQNPSPMVETTRAHERIADTPLPGETRTIAWPGARRAELFVPAAALKAKTHSLLLHFHGAAFLPNYAVTKAKGSWIAATLDIAPGSGIYDRTFSDPAAYDSLLAAVLAAARDAIGREVRVSDVVLSGFSAGHGAIRAILRDSSHFDAVAAVLLLDGMHTGYSPPDKVLHTGAVLDTTNLTAFRRFAAAAMRGEKRFLITHSEIFPGTFASTTETADFLLQSLGLKRQAVLEWGPLGMQGLSRAGKGRFEVYGYAGNTAPDHIDHFHGLFWFLQKLQELR